MGCSFSSTLGMMTSDGEGVPELLWTRAGAKAVNEKGMGGADMLCCEGPTQWRQSVRPSIGNRAHDQLSSPA